jgi:hypothetical protein
MKLIKPLTLATYGASDLVFVSTFNSGQSSSSRRPSGSRRGPPERRRARKIIRMMFHSADQDNIPLRLERKPPGEFIDRLSGVFAKNANERIFICVHEFKDLAAGCLVSMC